MKIAYTSFHFLVCLIIFGCSKSESPNVGSSGNQTGNDSVFSYSFDVGATHYQYTHAVLTTVTAGGKTLAKWDLKDSTMKISPGILQIVKNSVKVGPVSFTDVDFQFLNSSTVRYCWGKSQSTPTIYSTTGMMTITSTNSTGRFLNGSFTGYFHAFYTPSDSVLVTNGKFSGLKVP